MWLSGSRTLQRTPPQDRSHLDALDTTVRLGPPQEAEEGLSLRAPEGDRVARWQYAKIIADSAGVGKKQWAFVMERFKKLQSGEIAWDSIREYVKEHNDFHRCLYCGRAGDLTLDHLMPKAFHGPEDEKNAAWVCRSCNASKGARRLYEYWTVSKGGLKAAKYDVPRLAEGKYLRLLYELFDRAGVLGVTEDDLQARFCPECDLSGVCEQEDSVGKLSPLCLDGVATAVLQSRS